MLQSKAVFCNSKQAAFPYSSYAVANDVWQKGKTEQGPNEEGIGQFGGASPSATCRVLRVPFSGNVSTNVDQSDEGLVHTFGQLATSLP